MVGHVPMLDSIVVVYASRQGKSVRFGGSL